MISAQKIPNFPDYLCKAEKGGFAFLFGKIVNKSAKYGIKVQNS